MMDDTGAYNYTLPLVAQYRARYKSEFFCLDDAQHAYLCRAMSAQVSMSGVAENYICLSTRAFPKYAGLLDSFKALLAAKPNLMHFGMTNQIYRQQLCQIMAGYLIRNFKTTRIVRVETLVNTTTEFDQDPDVLIVPDLNSIVSENKRSFFAKNTRLSTILVDRYIRGRVTVVGYSTMEDLTLAVTPDVYDMVTTQGTQI